MGSFTDYLEEAALEHVLKDTATSQPTNLYVGLSSADPTDDGTGITEPAGNGYARVNHNSWNTASGRKSDNNGQIDFPTASGGDWGAALTHWFVADASSGGNIYFYGSIATPRVIDEFDQPSFADEELEIAFTSGGISNYLANALLDHFLKNTAYTVPTNLYVCLADDTITDSTTGSTISEPGSNYARKLHNTWNAASTSGDYKLMDNNGSIDFVQASGSWGTVTYAAIADALTNGNLLFYGDIVDKTIGTNDIASFASGSLDIRMK